VERKLYDGAVTIVGVDGKVVFEEAIGFADRHAGKPMRLDSVFPVFSISKALNAVLVLQRVERGEASLNTFVSEIIAEFAARGKQRITIGQLLSHSGGLPASFPAVPVEKIGDLDAVVAAVCDVGLEAVPGEEVSYSPIMAHAVLGQCVRRLDGGKRRLRDIAREELLEPLGMADTALGATTALAARAVMPRVSDESPGMFDASALVAGPDDPEPGIEHRNPGRRFRLDGCGRVPLRRSHAARRRLERQAGVVEANGGAGDQQSHRHASE
jgi:CubicO group peptidase (beta-lactamase class C family)